MGGAVPGSGLRGRGGRLAHPSHPRHRDHGAEAGLAQGRGHLQTSQGGQVSDQHSIPGSNLSLVFYTLIVLVNIDYCMKTMQCNTNKNLLTLAWLTIGYRQ